MPEQATLEGAAAIAVEKLKAIKAPAEAKAAEESKVASVEKVKQEQAEKDKGIKIAAEAEARVKEDARILSEDDTKLKDEDKKRKSELIKAKEAEEATPEAKIRRVQEATQKRIDEIKSEQLAKENKTAAELAALKAELEELKKPRQQEDIKTKVKREQTELIAKYVEEDKSKPKEERREMTKEELQTWYLEDPDEATAWISRRENRRIRDLEKAEESASKPVDNTAEKKKIADEFIAKQQASQQKLISKFPGIVPNKEKIVAIRTKLGLPLDRVLDKAEINKFNEEFAKENSEYKLLMEIVAENPKFLETTDGPELAMAEMEKRLKKPSSKIELTQEELDAKIKAEADRLRRLDGEGITSTGGGKKVETSNKEKSALRQIQEKAAKKAGMTVDELDKSIERRSTIKGASTGGADE